MENIRKSMGWCPSSKNEKRSVSFDRGTRPSGCVSNSKRNLDVNIGKDYKGNFVKVDLLNASGLDIYGASGTGKTNIVKMIVESLVKEYRPFDLKIIVMDGKGDNILKRLEKYEQVNYVYFDELDRYEYYLDILTYEIENRNKLLDNKGYLDWIEVRRENIKGRYPWITLIVDELDALSKGSDKFASKLSDIRSQCEIVGIRLITTNQFINSLYNKENINVVLKSHEKTIKEIFGENNIIKTDFDIGEGVVIDSYGFRYIKNII